MLEILKEHLIPSFINCFSIIYIISKLYKKNINLKDYKLYLSIIFFMFVSVLSYIYLYKNIKLLCMTLIVILINFIIFKKDVKVTLISSFLGQIIIVLSEIIFAFLVSIITSFDAVKMTNEFWYTYLCNICISILAIIIVNAKTITKIYNKILNITDMINTKTLFIYIVLILFSINILTFITYFKTNITIYLTINFLLFTIYFIIVISTFIEKNENIKFKQENKILLSNLNEYEKMLDYQRVNNHENKNQLLVIKSMIEKKDKKLMGYINEIIKEKREDDEIVYNKAKRIPSGGLQGLIYQKMLLMQEKNIEVNLDINSKVRKIDFGNLSSKMNYDICRIVGIIIDNAIEETTKFNKKNREIIISMYVDGLFIIEVSNRIKDDMDLSKIYEKGYTSKKKGHGYGLSLLKRIVDENENIINEVKIVNNIFTQVIKIKM